MLSITERKERQRKASRKYYWGHLTQARKQAREHKRIKRQDPAYGEKTRARQLEHKAWLWQFKSKPCADCGLSYPPWVMDFDHLREKKFNIAAHVNLSKVNLKVEIDKCDVVCANCHRARSHKRNPNGYRSTR